MWPDLHRRIFSVCKIHVKKLDSSIKFYFLIYLPAKKILVNVLLKLCAIQRGKMRMPYSRSPMVVPKASSPLL